MFGLIKDLLSVPAYWISVATLLVVAVISYRIRQRYGAIALLPSTAVILLLLVTAFQLTDLQAFGDIRQWIGGIIAVGTALCFVTLPVGVIPQSMSRPVAGFIITICALIGTAVAIVVAIYASCYLGIDCL